MIQLLFMIMDTHMGTTVLSSVSLMDKSEIFDSTIWNWKTYFMWIWFIRLVYELNTSSLCFLPFILYEESLEWCSFRNIEYSQSIIDSIAHLNFIWNSIVMFQVSNKVISWYWIIQSRPIRDLKMPAGLYKTECIACV